ncbi:hypothetical protein A2Z23_02645 [Candidatus Curtissbacteria bacterium RBG_16_39_7]|uniref:Uncharacterized protein n=1 Tax=Candidatus Curtissbacteria bacterium RBG_16_39_7 TaxID=1797707 RepID=A0A1F5G1P8_9BACT|nr:MAG: hypothetical protein A2Z23_02645 [Candidatus Curtissbacteria bacterium RBG_16_39_7]
MSQPERKDNPENVSDMIKVNWRCAGIGQIPCKAYLGRYPDHRLMALDAGKRHHSFYLNKDQILEEEGEGEDKISWVRVHIIKEIGENLLIVLPAPTFDSDDGRIVIPQEIMRDTKVPKEWVEEGLGIPSYMCH